jgi:predicted DNA-binding transcriptional regulator YafY
MTYRRGEVGPIARAFRVLNALRGFRRGRTLTELASEADVSTRTVRRDLAELADAGLRIEFLPVDGQPGACLADRGYANVPITTRERFTLLAVRSVFDVVRGTPLHEDVLSVLDKLDQRSDASGTHASAPMRACIAYIPDGGTKAYEDKLDVIDALLDGILQQRVVRYSYRDAGARARRGHLAAYAMLIYRQGLYVVGARLADATAGKNTSGWRDQLDVFAVERFVDADRLRERFDVPPDFQLDEVLHGAFGIHVRSNDGPQRVVVEFSKEKAALVRARVWHRTQQLTDLPDGGVRFSFSCVNLTPVVSWVLQWGPHARVIEPEQLRAQVVDELDRARARYT